MNAHHPVPAAFRRNSRTKLEVSAPKQESRYMDGDSGLFMEGFNPPLREEREDIQQAWVTAAGRAVEKIHNSGFLKGAIDTLISSIVGSGLRMQFRPDLKALGWTEDNAQEFIETVESAFKQWSNNKNECDAGGRMTFGQMQQAWLLHALTFGEGLALLPMKKTRDSTSLTKVSIIPPSRLSNETDENDGLYQGVYVDDWNAPIKYKITRNIDTFDENDVIVQAADRQGRANVIHVYEPVPATTRGISPFATILKVLRQYDQYFDATITKAMIQTIFAATLQNDAVGQATFDGLFTENDIQKGLVELGKANQAWYKGAKLDLSQHGRIASLFPGDKLDMTQSNMEADDFDRIVQWMLRECAAALGMSYDTFTQDDRGATYSSIRMSSAKEWQRVMKRRNNIVVPFCKTVFETWLEEQIGTGRIKFPGGLKKFISNKTAASNTNWAGPAKPQADDFKTARAYQVLVEMGATTKSAVAAEYGTDWEDDMVQQSRENAKADKLGLPRPWVSEIEDEAESTGESANLGAPNDGSSNDRKRKRRKRRGGLRDGGDPSEPKSSMGDELNTELEASLHANEDEVVTSGN